MELYQAGFVRGTASNRNNISPATNEALMTAREQKQNFIKYRKLS